jgi:hypothetical protein
MTCAGVRAATECRWPCAGSEGLSDPSSVTVARAARIFQFAAQPTQPVLEKGNGLLPLGCGNRYMGWIGWIQQLHQRRRDLFGGSPLGLALEGMPLAVINGEQAMQGLRRFAAALRPRFSR